MQLPNAVVTFSGFDRESGRGQNEVLAERLAKSESSWLAMGEDTAEPDRDCGLQFGVSG
jgi:hypothetical protein